MPKLTPNEIAVLRAIDASEYGDALTDGVWTFSVQDHCGLPVRSLGGTVASLSKKGFVVAGDSGDDAYVQMTDAGAAVYIETCGPSRKHHDLPVPPAPKVQAAKAPQIKSREEWLNTMLHRSVAPLLKRHGAVVPADCKVSVGFPGGGSARKRIGECWPRERSSIKVNEIFLNPAVKDVSKLVDVLIHEAIHASDNCVSGHKGYFRKVAVSVGMTGKMTCTVAGPELAQWIAVQIASMPAFDYGSLDLSSRKKQPTLMRKVECVDCGYIVRTTDKWLALGTPTCCCGGDMVAA